MDKKNFSNYNKTELALRRCSSIENESRSRLHFGNDKKRIEHSKRISTEALHIKEKIRWLKRKD